MADPARLVELTVAEEPHAWAALGFSVVGGRCPLGGVDLVFAGRAGDDAGAITGWGWSSEIADAIDGLTTYAAPEAGTEPAQHPNRVTALDHLVITSGDGERTATAITAATGREVRRVRDAGKGRQQWFIVAGASVIELLAPVGSPDERARFWGITPVVGDPHDGVADSRAGDGLDRLARQLGDRLGTPKDAVQPGRRIATLRRDTSEIEVPVAFMTPRQGA